MRKHRGDVILIILSLVLVGIGLLIMYTIGPVRANFLNSSLADDRKISEMFFFTRQLMSVGFAIGAFFIFSKVFKYQKIHKWSKIIIAIALGMCLILAMAQVIKIPIASCKLGGCRWLNLGGLSIQPAEFLKLATVIYLADLFYRYRGGNFIKNKEFMKRFILVVGISLFFVVVMQKDLGSGLPIVAIVLAILIASGEKKKNILLVMVIILLLGVGSMISSPHRRERLMTFFGMSANSKEEDRANSYHIENALIAIGTGGLFGVGMGNSVQATGYLPESINDSIFAIMGETLGFLKLVLMLGLFFWLLMRILNIADRSMDYRNYLIAIGAFAWIMTHVIVNIMAMTGIMPLTGITLPLLSYGGTSMMATGAILGLIYQISQYTRREKINDRERILEAGVSEQNKRQVKNEIGYNRGISYRRQR